jgi:hypothetical protein
MSNSQNWFLANTRRLKKGTTCSNDNKWVSDPQVTSQSGAILAARLRGDDSDLLSRNDTSSSFRLRTTGPHSRQLALEQFALTELEPRSSLQLCCSRSLQPLRDKSPSASMAFNKVEASALVLSLDLSERALRPLHAGIMNRKRIHCSYRIFQTPGDLCHAEKAREQVSQYGFRN